MDTLDELNAKLEELCGIAERECERLLDGLMSAAYWHGEDVADPASDPADSPGQAPTRMDVAQIALDYAEWTRIAKEFRAQLRARNRPVSVVK